MRRRLPAILLALVVLGSAGFHAYRAEHPTSGYQSADERSYGKLALNLADRGHYGDRSTAIGDALHWPPGAPALFALAHEVAPDEASVESRDIPAAYWAQAIVSLGTVLAAFGLAWALAGPWIGLLAAALVGFYPPLILATGEQISEPFGAFLLTTGLAVLAWAVVGRHALSHVLAGALLGATVLTRADLVLVPFLVALLVFLWAWRTEDDARGGLATGALVVGGALLLIGPWSVYASKRSGEFVPVTTGSAAALFVGTYLPGNGTTVGMKRALADEVYARRPDLRKVPPFELEARVVLREAVAYKHPELSTDAAIAKEARHNISHYASSDPVGYARMMLNKVQRMWTRYARGGARHTDWKIRAWHILLVVGGFAGLVAGLWRRRELLLAAVLIGALYSTALHMLVVSQGRYNLPLMPGLVAAGAAGWALWWRARERSDREPAGPPPPPVEERLYAPTDALSVT